VTQSDIAAATERSFTPAATRVVDEMVRLLGEMDVHDIRVGDLARRAGVAIPTIYYNFSSLDDIIAEATVVWVRRFLDPLIRAFDELEQAIEDDDAVAFATAATLLIECYWSEETISGVHRSAPLIAYFRQIAPEDLRLRKLQARMVGGHIAALTAAQAKGWIDPADDVGAFVIIHWTCVLGQAVFHHPSFGPLTAIDFSQGVGRLKYRTTLSGDIGQMSLRASDPLP
jgi:AcrR family transcriptional regulator